MARILIDDLDDPRIAVYRSLKATNQTRGLDAPRRRAGANVFPFLKSASSKFF
jgi:hypothetical protein